VAIAWNKGCFQFSTNRYINVTLGKYQDHAVEAYDKAKDIRRVGCKLVKVLLFIEFLSKTFVAIWLFPTHGCLLRQARKHFSNFQKEQSIHKNTMKGGPFRLNLCPASYFDGNPYRSDRPLRPARSASRKLPPVKPFKPSSPAKKVSGLFVSRSNCRSCPANSSIVTVLVFSDCFATSLRTQLYSCIFPICKSGACGCSAKRPLVALVCRACALNINDIYLTTT